MTDTNCPLCYTELIVKDTTPCMECGSVELELDHFKNHDYKEYELYFGQRLILCDFCVVDFSSFDPTYFGFSAGKKLGFGDWAFIQDIHNKNLRKDKYCPQCKHRLPFLKFVYKCRQENEKNNCF